jgi:hypothetical protein
MRFTQGKSDKFLTVVSNLDSGEPLWFGQGTKEGDARRVLPNAVEEQRNSELLHQRLMLDYCINR